MENTWLHFLKDLEVSCFSSGDGMRYAVHEPRSGKIFLTNRTIAQHLNALQNGQTDLAVADQNEMAKVYGFIETVRNASTAELTAKPPFNPLFVRWKGLDLGKYDRPLARWAACLGPFVWPVFIGLFLCCLGLGVISEWAILGAATQMISIEGLATFALMSPFLKLPHELGHALAARRFDVPLRNAGIIFVGLFPLPFVDTSAADICANKNQRIRISLAGIFVDLLIAMTAFVAWYLVDGTFLKTITANIFIFSSLNSLLFNGNPLMRLDGYFAFSDWIGHRNLSSAAAQIFKNARTYCATFGGAGASVQGRKERMYLFYGVASGLYKINILLTILWLTLPRFFGLGLLLAIWGGYAMFFSPLLNKLQAEPVEGKQSYMGRRAVFWGGVLAVTGACLFIPLPFKVTVPVSLDTNGTYAVQTQAAGVLRQISDSGQVDAGTVLFAMDNPVLDQDIALAREILVLANAQRDNVLQRDATQTRIATAQLEAPQKELEVLLVGLEAMTLSAPQSGIFRPSTDARTGAFFAEGSRLGYLLPDVAQSVVIGQFPEDQIARLRDGDPEYSLWNAGDVFANDTVIETRLVQINQLAAETGQRTYQLIAHLNLPPNALHGRQQYLKLTLETAPVYTHLYEVFLNLRRSYLNARIGQGAN
ncbi:hypothetical protein L0664_14890 [Octadecabacter sp. G9-8]|uniref:Peptidase M50 domain-containing protein n=1 Tax=Octadecabacter dasysiphoniae TaxID=2909341 RepID=A0ABS9CYU6_9RHOB|nr:site-2 protease family protein [Octadecabacter dasysiphoniae]MCF2872359.1 hypothetical protein [Octadecabacter dasysiphoniae]